MCPDDRSNVILCLFLSILGQNFQTATAIDRLDNLMSKLCTLVPYGHQIVTNLLERSGPNDEIQSDFNPFVQDKVNGQVASGCRVTYLDMRSYVPLSDMPDLLHPNDIGYNKMSQAWTSSVTNMMSPLGDSLPPGIIRAVGEDGGLSVSITFSKPLSDTSVSSSTYFTIDNELQVLSTSLSDDKRVISLATTQQTVGVIYTITVDSTGAVMDLMGNAVASSDDQITFATKRPRGYENNVPSSEWSGYVRGLTLDIPSYAAYGASSPVYAVDNREFIPSSFSRIAYYIELEKKGLELNYLWVSMDSFTSDRGSIGVPTSQLFDQTISISGMNVYSSVPSINTGTNLPGWIEFYPTNYAEGPDNVFNQDDTQLPDGDYGAMQIHQGSDTLFAFNNWASSAFGAGQGAVDIGLGNNGSGNQDWTFARNGQTYSIRHMEVFVLPSNDVISPTLISSSSFGRNNMHYMTARFSEPLDPASINIVVSCDSIKIAHLCLLFLKLVGSHFPHPRLPRAGIPTEVPDPNTVILILFFIMKSC